MAKCTCGYGGNAATCKKHANPPTPRVPGELAVVGQASAWFKVPLSGGAVAMGDGKGFRRMSIAKHHVHGYCWNWRDTLEDGTLVYLYGFAPSFQGCIDALNDCLYRQDWRVDKLG